MNGQHGVDPPHKGELHMIVSMPQPAEAPAKEPATKPEPVEPCPRYGKGGKFVVKMTSATQKPKPMARGKSTKTAKILRLLQRPEGASLNELTQATKWQAHSVRGFLSGTVKRKMHLKLTTLKRPDGERAYRIRSK
jgi:uncharacterized protein DUF3489